LRCQCQAIDTFSCEIDLEDYDAGAAIAANVIRGICIACAAAAAAKRSSSIDTC
jgi:hypothetical protein